MTTTPNSWLPQPLRKLGGRALQAAFNHALALDPDTQQQLPALNGRSVQLHLHGPEIAFGITVTDGKLQVGPAQDDASLRVAATPGSLLGMLLNRDSDHVAPGKVEIAGDADLARRLQKLASAFAPDFEEAFARTFGDVLGVPIARAVREGLSHMHDTATHLREDGADWLRDEARLALAPGEVEGFLDGVDTVRERSERLQARVARLSARVRGNAT
ncbi:MAG: SCP2 sterol-binding domain-containing protein [Rhodanobacter sp.]